MATDTVANDPVKSALIDSFRPEEIHGRIVGNALKTKALQALEQMEIPTRKWEEWKYTRLNTLVKESYQTGHSFEIDNIEPYLIPELDADVLVFLNGEYAPQLSRLDHMGDDLIVKPLSELKENELSTFESYLGTVVDTQTDIFTAMNAAFLHQGTFIHIPPNTIAEYPVHILHLTHPQGQTTGIQHRNVFVAETGSQAKIIESFHSVAAGKTLRNAATEIYLHPNSKIEYVKLQQESRDASQIDHTSIHQKRDSHLEIYTVTFGGKIVRNNLHIGLHGQNSEAHLMGIYMLDGIQHVDNHTQVDHAVANCYSNELYKGIMHEQSTGVFNGRIHVYRDAQKTNAFQSNRNILLSDNANIFTKPQLEIYADDVKCSHGATTGRLDKDAMFYLRARGLKEEVAKKLLIQAFAAEVVENISMEPLAAYLVSLIESRY